MDLMRKWDQALRFFDHLDFRLKHGFSKYQVWSAKSYIAEYALPLVDYLSDNVNSYPDGLTHKKWKTILKKIAKALAHECYGADNKRLMKIIKKYYPDDSIFMPETKAQEKKLLALYKANAEGLELFGKYFVHLWD